MGHQTTVKEDVGVAVRGFIVLLIVTFIEVGLALLGNGHISESITLPKLWVMMPLMVGASLFKAYYIVSIFMHLGHETRPMAASIVLPMLLFVWAITAFLWEGWSWRSNKNYVNDKNQEKVDPNAAPKEKIGGVIRNADEISKEVSFQ